MKKILKKIKNNIMISTIIFIAVNIIINFLLYLLNIRFRLYVLIIIILISVFGFIVGFIQQIKKDKDYITLIMTTIAIVVFGILISLFLPIIAFIGSLAYNPEHIVTIDDKKYVAVVKSFLNVNVYYYDYYGLFLMGTKVKIYGDFGKGGYDPYRNPNALKNVIFTYYDNNGKEKYKKLVVYETDEKGKVIENESKIIDDDYIFNENENYILPENEPVLYEKKFNDFTLRFSKIDDTLGQKMLVHVLKSNSNGKGFNVVTEETINVNRDSKFIFLNENIGFISQNKIILKDSRGLYVTIDGGKTFNISKFNYVNNNVEFIEVEKLPYYENEILKIKCSAYQVKEDNSGYENKELIFTSNDNGLTWNL